MHRAWCISAYLAKIGLEMALGNVKQGRGSGRGPFSPMQLLFELVVTGADAARRSPQGVVVQGTTGADTLPRQRR